MIDRMSSADMDQMFSESVQMRCAHGVPFDECVDFRELVKALIDTLGWEYDKAYEVQKAIVTRGISLLN